MEVKVDGLAQLGRRLRALPVELGSKGGGPLRSALFQAAKIVRENAKTRVRVRTGFLKENIVMTRHRNPSQVGATEYYGIGMKGGTRKLANNSRNRRARRAGAMVRTAGQAYYGRFLELGTSKMSAQPFLRPALASTRDAAVRAFAEAFKRAIERAERKVSSLP